MALDEHQLFDIEVIIKKSLVFSGMFAFALGIFLIISILVSGELTPLTLQEVIDGFCQLYLPELKANSIYFTQEIPAEPIPILGVIQELQQVLIILAKNAVHSMKYSQEKRITLKVNKLNSTSAQIALSDTGYGIKKEKIHSIFAPLSLPRPQPKAQAWAFITPKALLPGIRGESGRSQKG